MLELEIDTEELREGLDRLSDVDGNPVEVVDKVTEIPVFIDVVETLSELLGMLVESPVLSEVVEILTDVDDRLKLEIETVEDTPVLIDVVGKLVDILDVDTDTPVFIVVEGRLIDNPVLTLEVGRLIEVKLPVDVLLRTPEFKLVLGIEAESEVDGTLVQGLIDGDVDSKPVES